MALANCVAQVLCGLAAATRAAIASLIDKYLIALRVARAELEAQLVVLDIASAPIIALNNLAQQALLEVKAGANLIPLDLIGNCLDVGRLNETIQANLDIVAGDISIVAQDLARLVSFRDEVEASIRELDRFIDTYLEILEIIDGCDAITSVTNEILG